MQLDYIIQAFEVYTDGFGKAGSGEKCSMPKLKKKQEDFRGGGMLAPRKVSLGYEPFEFSADLSAFDPQVLALGRLFSGAKDIPFAIRGYMDGDQNSKHESVCQMRGEIVECDPGDWEAGKKAMLKFKAAPSSIKLTIDGVVIWDIDIQNNVYAVGGQDPYIAVRAALGF
ncbi:phage major tail tube protein [Methylosinus sp. Sm6]|uniref:phage major tail tube protein n=1 Tax=Methylosinus sp. Sm6 TaxID=2866948 RepID=UPI001C998876|nr:phage major tail tube protein [Methylosinus sp. Sm6]MBY6244126.1 phage major tail tube protein [Methylosinus sp. Sm6]